MNKALKFALTFCCVLMIFSSGCGNQKIEDSASKVNENEHYSLEQIITEIEEQGISEIKIFKSEGHGSSEEH